MKGLSALAALGVVGALSFVMLDDPGGGGSSASHPVQKAKEASLSYQLRVSGREGSCTVVKRGLEEEARSELEIGHECINLMPRLAEARYWQEDSAGEVTFVAADGRAVVEFFAADGVAYESLRPISPLVALTAQ